jgi:hypothetical protein
MTVAKAEEQNLARNSKGLLRALRGGAVLLGALLLSWPAFFNGYPLIYPDSMTYLDDGPTVARAVFLHQFSDYYGERSFFYSLGILPFHWNLSAWPIVGLQCLLVAWIVWLVVRSFQSRPAASWRSVVPYLILILFLSSLTSVSWYAAFIMPDILGSLVYLSFFLLAFARETLSRTERLGVYLIAWWGITSHTSHLLLAAGLLVLLVLFAAFERKPFWRRLRSLGELAAIIAIAASAQMALHGYLYGKPSLSGERPPYLMARIIADGPGRWYLDMHCDRRQWAVCDRYQKLSDNVNDLLWGAENDPNADTLPDREHMVREEMPFVLAVVRAYPGAQLSKSAANFRDQFLAFGLYGFDPSDWILAQFKTVLPRERASFISSRQERSTLPLDQFTNIQWWTIIASLAAMAVLIPFLWRRHSPRLVGLFLIVAASVVANALVTGVLSVVDDRYQCRVIWLVPLLAGICFIDWLGPGTIASAAAINKIGKHSSV